MKYLLDSSVWISYFHTKDVYHNQAIKLIDDAISENNIVLVPNIVYAEVLNSIWRITKSDLHIHRCKKVFHECEPYIRLIHGDRFFWLEGIESIMPRVSLKTSDLIIASYAWYHKVDKFVTYDKAFKKEIDKLYN